MFDGPGTDRHAHLRPFGPILVRCGPSSTAASQGPPYREPTPRGRAQGTLRSRHRGHAHVSHRGRVAAVFLSALACRCPGVNLALAWRCLSVNLALPAATPRSSAPGFPDTRQKFALIGRRSARTIRTRSPVERHHHHPATRRHAAKRDAGKRREPFPAPHDLFSCFPFLLATRCS